MGYNPTAREINIASHNNFRERNMKKRHVFLLTFILLPIGGWAENSSFYVGLGYGKAGYEGEEVSDILLAPGQRLDDEANFVDLYIGYQLNEHISFEVGYADFDEFSDKYDLSPDVMSIAPANTIEEVDISRISFGTLIEYPIWKSASVFGLLGYSYFDFDQKTRPFSFGNVLYNGEIKSDSNSEEGIFWGLGAKYNFCETLSARAQWARSNTNAFDLDSIRLSLEMKFNKL